MRTKGLGRALGRVLGRVIGGRGAAEQKEAPQRERPTTSARRQRALAPIHDDDAAAMSVRRILSLTRILHLKRTQMMTLRLGMMLYMDSLVVHLICLC